MKNLGICLLFCLCLMMCNSSQKAGIITTPPNKNVPLVRIETKQSIEDDPKTAGTIQIFQTIVYWFLVPLA